MGPPYEGGPGTIDPLPPLPPLSTPLAGRHHMLVARQTRLSCRASGIIDLLIAMKRFL